jgi:hypothetical protein
MSSSVPKLVMHALPRMPRGPSIISVPSIRNSSRIVRSARISPPQTMQTPAMKARSALSSRSFSLSMLPPMLPALAPRSPALLVPPLPLLLVLVMDVATLRPVIFLYDAQVLQIDTHHPILPVAIQSMMPHITLQLGTNLIVATAQASNVSLTLQQRYAQESTTSSLLLQSSTPPVLPRSSFPTIILPSFFQVLSRMI